MRRKKYEINYQKKGKKDPSFKNEVSNLNGLDFKYFKSLTSEDELVNKIINMWNVIHHLLWKFVNSNK